MIFTFLHSVGGTLLPQTGQLLEQSSAQIRMILTITVVAIITIFLMHLFNLPSIFSNALIFVIVTQKITFILLCTAHYLLF